MYSVGIIILFLVCSSFSMDLPSYLSRCYLDDPKLSECVLRAFKEVKPYANNGIEEIGLPPLNPFVVPKFTVQQESSLANYTIKVTNYTIEGLNNHDIKEFRYDPETMTYRFKIEFDSLSMSVSVEGDSDVVHIPLKGNGFVRIAHSPVTAIFEIKGDMKRLRGIEYYSTEKAKVGLDMGDGNYNFEGLFNNNELLVRMTNEKLSANSAMVVEALTPAYEKFASMDVMRFMKTLTKIPYHRLFP
ncbi:hypothetical protein ILUMI_07974 [Ignelater luminosus]|uniref:Uncharacterized protein n=1 Tax=Ignelater luminosus TaxID=2038154 RepID=A0A8K0GFU5_IGNLU|nr:hypothetical protein ILUMI_07974 [Ignelater luminosus]